MKLASAAALFAVFLVFAFPVLSNAGSIEMGEVVVSALKMNEPKSESTSPVTVVNSGDISSSNAQLIVDVLKSVPDVHIVQAGGQGRAASIFLRGASPTQTLVMIDGVKVKSNSTGEFDLSGLMAEDIERIEIVKGPQSTTYGSDAIGGVINIITKKGEGRLHAEASYEFGSHDTSKPSASVSGSTERISYRVNASYLSTDGISTASSGTEKDMYENASFSGKLNITPVQNLSVELNGRYSTEKTGLDGWDFVEGVIDDANRHQYTDRYLASITATARATEAWEQTLTLSKTNEDYKIKDPDNPFETADIKSETQTAEWQNNFFMSEQHTVSAGIEYRNEAGENKDSFDESITNVAVYVNNRVSIKEGGLTLNAGARMDDHEAFGTEYTYRVGAVQEMPAEGMRFRASYGTGFRAPTLNDLYYSGAFGSGNPDVKPEKSTSWEVGVEQDYSKRLSLSIGYFDQKYEDLIDWAPDELGNWMPQNISEAKISGLETWAQYYLTEALRADASYNYFFEIKNETKDENLNRRPKDRLGVSLAYSMDRVNIKADYQYVGKRREAAIDGDLPAYSLVNLSGSYKLSNMLTLFARAENILDEDYEEAGGFGTLGASYYGGIKAVF